MGSLCTKKPLKLSEVPQEAKREVGIHGQLEIPAKVFLF